MKGRLHCSVTPSADSELSTPINRQQYRLAVQRAAASANKLCQMTIDVFYDLFLALRPAVSPD